MFSCNTFWCRGALGLNNQVTSGDHIDTKQLTVLWDSNKGTPPVVGTGKNYQREMLPALGMQVVTTSLPYWWSSFEVWGPFLLRRKRPQWSPFWVAFHWTLPGKLTTLSFFKGRYVGVLAFLLVQTFLVNTPYYLSLNYQVYMWNNTCFRGMANDQ